MADQSKSSSRPPHKLIDHQEMQLFLDLEDESLFDSDFSESDDIQETLERHQDAQSSESEDEIERADATPVSAPAGQEGTGDSNCAWDWHQVISNQASSSHEFRFPDADVSAGVKANESLSQESSPLDIFSCIFTPELMTHLVKSINDYARFYKEKNSPGRKRSFVYEWTDVTVGEMYKFFAVIIQMGMDRKPRVRDHFTVRPAGYTQWYHDMFSRNRFEAIFHTALHVGDVDANGKHKIEPFVSKLIERFQALFYPYEEVSINEMAVGFQGRFSSKQYNPSKPEKHHIKHYGLCDSRTGYVYNLLTYFGSATSYADSSSDQESHAVRVFDTLLICLHKGHHIYADKSFTSTQLLRFLLNKGFNYTGTVMTNRKNLPPEVKSMKLKHGEAVFFQSQNPIDSLCVMWRDKKAKKPVVAISTKASTEEIVVTEWRSKVTKPALIHDYNLFINGCDLTDQMTSFYGSHHCKALRWWKKTFFSLFEICQANAHVIYTLLQADNQKKISLRTFKEKLVDAFVAEAASRGDSQRQRNLGKRLKTDDMDRVSGLHLVDSAGKDRDCAYCSSSKKRKRTTYYCTGCASKPFLCPKSCFRAYHEKAMGMAIKIEPLDS